MAELHLHHPDYDPNKLLDAIIERLQVNTDVELARVLDVLPPLISKIRHRRLGVGATMLIAMHEVSGLSIKELRMLMGDRRAHFCSIQMQGKKKGPPKRSDHAEKEGVKKPCG